MYVHERAFIDHDVGTFVHTIILWALISTLGQKAGPHKENYNILGLRNGIRLRVLFGACSG